MEINNFREAFERGDDPLADITDANDINAVAGVLKLYLRELREPVFSVQYFDQYMDLSSKSIFFVLLIFCPLITFYQVKSFQETFLFHTL